MMLFDLKKKVTLIVIFISLFGYLTWAQSFIPDSLQTIINSANDAEKVILLNRYANILKINSPQSAVELYKLAATIAEKNNDFSEYSKAMKNGGAICAYTGSFNQARELLQKALKVAQQNKFEIVEAESHYYLGTISFATGNLSGAVQSFLDALRLFEGQKNIDGLLGVYGSLADVYLRQNNFSKAIEYNQKALRIYEKSNNRFRQLSGYETLGSIYLKQNNFVKSEEYFRKAFNIYKEIGNKTGMGFTIQQIGKIKLETKSYTEAINHFKSSLKIANELNVKPLITANYNGIANSYFALKEYEKASSYYNLAIDKAKETGLTIELEEAYEGLAKLFEITREQKKAIAYQTLSRDIKDSLFNDSTLKKISDLQLKFEAEKQKIQIDLLKKNEALNQIELQKATQLRNFFIFVAGLLLLIAAIFFYITSINKRISKQLEKNNAELERKHDEIAEQTEELTQLIKVKDRFYSIISHDLRNNLTTMKLYFDLISHKDYKPESNPKLTSEISSCVENTIDLLENLLEWSSSQIKGKTINIQRLSIYTLAQENIQLLLANALGKSITLENNVDDDVFAMGDVDMINLVIRNLISNAIKFTPENGNISIISELDGDFLNISVIDNGIGIGKDKLNIIFTQYQSSNSKGTGNEKGTGLGLMLCKEFVEKCHGKIWVESEEGRGSVFTFSLPQST